MIFSLLLHSAKDVAVALGYGNSREALRKHVEQEDVTKRDTPTAGGTQQMQYVNESGLYSLILSSKLESARRFKHWVTADSMCGRSSRHEKSSRFAQANEMQACLRFLSERSQSKKVINHQ